MQPDPSKIRALLKKTQHHDKDERYVIIPFRNSTKKHKS